MACNDSYDVMDSIMANKAYHEECRDCLNNPKAMKLEPAWFRVGLKGMPKAFHGLINEKIRHAVGLQV
jgi:hypothetical protein